MDRLFKTIGESGWVDETIEWLDRRQMEIEPSDDIEHTEERLDCTLPDSMCEYFTNIGIHGNYEFMQNLYGPAEFISLEDSDWDDIKDNYSSNELESYIVFAESEFGDPVCFKKGSDEIYLFTTDTLDKGVIFSDFKDYFINAILDVEKEEWEDMPEEEELKIKEEQFSDNMNIDEDIRIAFLFGISDDDDDDDDDDEFEDDEEDGYYTDDE